MDKKHTISPVIVCVNRLPVSPGLVFAKSCEKHPGPVLKYGPIWQAAEDFPLREDQACGYYVCIVRKGKCKVLREVFLKGTLARKSNGHFLVKAYRVNAPFNAAQNPYVVVGSLRMGKWPTRTHDSKEFKMKEGQREGFFICRIGKDGRLKVLTEATRKEHKYNECCD